MTLLRPFMAACGLVAALGLATAPAFANVTQVTIPYTNPLINVNPIPGGTPVLVGGEQNDMTMTTFDNGVIVWDFADGTSYVWDPQTSTLTDATGT